jgi:hypothetical protein
MLFNVSNNLCDAMYYSRYLLSADSIKIYRAISSPKDCSPLESDIDSRQHWWTPNYMKLNTGKTKVIF